ncbi:MAG: SGNH/GDSL hydrolase family protein [Candidatus Babeliaceae bacterium]|jgi:hypothetical protein
MGQTEYIFTYNDVTKIPFSIHWTASKTIRDVITQGLDITQYGARENDIALFTFGEVDVRHYSIDKERENKNFDKVLDSLVANYIAIINQNKKRYNNFHCIIMEVMPPVSNPGFYGPLADRISITHALNKKLSEACRIHDILFLRLHDLYANPDGSLNSALSDGCVHINMNHNLPLRRRLIELLLESKINVH